MTRRRLSQLLLDPRNRTLIERLLRDYVLRHGHRIAVALACMAVASAATAGLAYAMEDVFNSVFAVDGQSWIWLLALGVFAIFLVKGLATYGQAVLMSIVGFRVVADLQGDLYRRLMAADLAFFHSTSPGGLVSRFLHDVNLLRDTVSKSVTSIGLDLLSAVALIGVMFYQDWRLALIAIIVFPTAIYPIVRIGRRVRKIATVTQEQTGLLSTLLDETFQGARTVKAYGMEDYEIARATGRFDRVYQLNFKNALIRNIASPVMEILGGLAVVAVMIYGGTEVLGGTRNPGTFASFLAALLLAYEPIKRLAKLNSSLQEGLSAADRIFSLIDSPPQVVDRPDARPLAPGAGAVHLEGVSFAYGDNPTLNEVSLEVPAGKTAALVGASGAGKSTVLNLIPRFYDVDAGAVLLDGQDVRSVTQTSLRASIALVSQETILFDDTLRANIAYGRPDASDAAIERAAQLAGAAGFIAELPQGYDTPVGPRGSRLSGGQRQRIAIARALLKDAPVLLLDEATSALDSESERYVRQALRQLMQGRTTLVIAHRLSTVIDADVIFVMDQGRIVEQGSHGDLLHRGGAYARLYAMQFAEQAEAAEPSGLPAPRDLRAQA